jgi:ubiquinone/menaquinone biosynthesis C-methylase UbiE
MKKWESNDTVGLLNLMVGDEFGENPAERIDVIRSAKAESARSICEILGIEKDSVVLEIGSGMGFTSKHVAKRAKYLHCCDISDSFINFARNECMDVENISFRKLGFPRCLDFEENYFDIVYSDAVFIHLNLYDIFLYFSEFKKVVKNSGIVAFNIMNPSKIETKKLVQMVNLYKNDHNCISELLCWNSVEAVIYVGEYFGFNVIDQRIMGPVVMLKFEKRST